nr:polysaccharide deacetylase family protein [Maliibacterium massiliense]
MRKMRIAQWGALALCLLLVCGCAPLAEPVVATQGARATPTPARTQAMAKAEPTPTPAPTPTPPQMVPVDAEQVRHLFFHCLIAYPDAKNAPSALNDCITVPEFQRTLQQVYQNGYVLVDTNDIFEERQDGTVTKKSVLVPEGKKPLILSVDDMVYDSRKMDWGMVSKLVLDDKGNIATYAKKPDGTEEIAYDKEVIPILEDFIARHPDFSPTGARMCIALTGFMGIFGYRTQADSPNRASEIEQVKPIIARLRELGYTFASHGYGHGRSREMSYNYFAQDTKQWNDEVGTLVGPTKIYVYPYGQQVFPEDAKHQLLRDYGFRMMWGVYHEPVWKEQGVAVYGCRQGIDGYSLENYEALLSAMIDTKTVYDAPGRRKG